jgi:hypothetical protein
MAESKDGFGYDGCLVRILAVSISDSGGRHKLHDWLIFSFSLVRYWSCSVIALFIGVLMPSCKTEVSAFKPQGPSQKNCS